MKIKLSEAHINDAIKKVDFLIDDIKIATEDMVSDLVDYGSTQASMYNSIAEHTDYNNIPIIESGLYDNGTSGYVSLSGVEAVYDEFGTGEIGAIYPHPWHDNVVPQLNAYNSGPFVSRHVDKNGNHFWFYNKELNYGIPAGKQMYNTARDIRMEKFKAIERNLNGAIKSFNAK